MRRSVGTLLQSAAKSLTARELEECGHTPLTHGQPGPFAHPFHSQASTALFPPVTTFHELIQLARLPRSNARQLRNWRPAAGLSVWRNSSCFINHGWWKNGGNGIILLDRLEM